MTETEFKLYLALGLCAPGVWGGQKEATMYSYNGVVLPKLPEWDKSKYLYAMIAVQYGSYTLTVSDVKQAANIVGSEYWSSFADNGKFLSFSLKDGVWSGGTTEYAAKSGVNKGRLGAEGFVWANHDVYEQEWTSNSTPAIPTDTILLHASDPIPVYE